MRPTRLWRPAIEFNLTEHCNLSCTHCDHASSILPTKFADLESFERDIRALSTALEAGQLTFLGGEPLLHPQLLDFLRLAKDVQIANRIFLVTNGVLLHKAPDELWELIDGMWISVYPGIKYRFDWDWIQRKVDEHQIFVWRKETPEFAQKSLNKEIRSEELVQMVFDNCELAHMESCHTIYEGRYYMCSPSVWMEPRLALHGIDFKNRESDSVAIHGNDNLYEDLDNLIRRRRPLEGCRYCLGSWARSTPNEQLTRKRTVEFLTRKPDDLTELVSPEMIIPRHYIAPSRPE